MDLVQILVDGFSIVASIALIITLYFLAYQQRTKNKITSIRLCQDFLIKTDKNQKFREVNNAINNSRDGDLKDNEIELFLDEYEDLAYFWQRGAVDFKDLKEIHGAVLSKARKSKRVSDYLKQKRKEDEFYFRNLDKLFKKDELSIS